jgi:hypothetical protein
MWSFSSKHRALLSLARMFDVRPIVGDELPEGRVAQKLAKLDTGFSKPLWRQTNAPHPLNEVTTMIIV